MIRHLAGEFVGGDADYRFAFGCPLGGDELSPLIQQALDNRPGHTPATATRLDRCLEAAEQIDRNANQTTLIETWLDDLAGIST